MTSPVRKLPKSRVELEIELSPEELEAYYQQALLRLAEDFEAPGFRKGYAPAEIVERELGAPQILSEAARLAISQEYRKTIAKEGLDVIGAPTVQILKMARGNPFIFRMQSDVVPSFPLPDYRKVASQVQRRNVMVQEKEVQDALVWIQKSKANEDGVLPELDDKFAKALGHFENFPQLKISIVQGLQREKELQESQRVRQEILEKISESIDMEIPQILVEQEKKSMLQDLKSQTQNLLKLEFQEYLQKIQMSEQALLESFEKDAQKRVKTSLVLRAISRQEQIQPTSQEIQERANLFVRAFPSVEAAKKQLDMERLRDYTRDVLINEKTLQLLEELALPAKTETL